MKFAIIGHFIEEVNSEILPDNWKFQKFYYSPKIKIKNAEGYFLLLPLSAKQIMSLQRPLIRKEILNSALFMQDFFDVDLVQLGALTTSVTSGGIWLTSQKEYTGYVNHGDSYTAATAIKIVEKILGAVSRKKAIENIAIVGSYGIIGEALSIILTPKFDRAILIGRRQEKLKKLGEKLTGNYTLSNNISDVRKADLVITATNHPSALLQSNHIKKDSIVIDVSQPPNLSRELCAKRKDIIRVDGGYVDLPVEMQLPALPKNKIFSCIAEVMMQAMERERKNHVGSIDLNHLEKTLEWARKYNFGIDELTSFGEAIF